MNRWTMENYKSEAEILLRKLPSTVAKSVREEAFKEWQEKGGKLMSKPWYTKEKIKYNHAEAAYLLYYRRNQIRVENTTNIGVQVTGGSVNHASGTGTKVVKTTKKTIKKAPPSAPKKDRRPLPTDKVPTDIAICMSELFEGMELASEENSDVLVFLQTAVRAQRVAIAKKTN